MPLRREPLFLTLEEVLSLHADQIDRYGGLPGLRDPGLLSSALAMPQASFSGKFLHATVHEMAAAYLFHLTQDHPFLDGNKRSGLAAAMRLAQVPFALAHAVKYRALPKDAPPQAGSIFASPPSVSVVLMNSTNAVSPFFTPMP